MSEPSYDESVTCVPQGAATRCQNACGQVCNVEVIHADAVRSARAALPTAIEQTALARLFTLFSNPTRMNLLVALRSVVGAEKPELCVCDLVAITGASQSMVSHQLGLLREAKLAVSRRAGRLVYYRLSEGPVTALLDDALRAVRTEAA
ncbi:MAG: transcriptional regulator [Myxococcaceae bacterium]|nr:MAG: transcriptional regulator [Myxococcaceae bacterium]